MLPIRTHNSVGDCGRFEIESSILSEQKVSVTVNLWRTKLLETSIDKMCCSKYETESEVWMGRGEEEETQMKAVV